MKKSFLVAGIMSLLAFSALANQALEPNFSIVEIFGDTQSYVSINNIEYEDYNFGTRAILSTTIQNHFNARLIGARFDLVCDNMFGDKYLLKREYVLTNINIGPLEETVVAIPVDPFSDHVAKAKDQGFNTLACKFDEMSVALVDK